MAMEVWLLITVSLLSVIVFIFFMVLILIYIFTSPYPDLTRHEKETYFVDPKSGATCSFPSIKDAPSIDLSVVVPAYNEEERLPVMLDEAITYLEKRSKASSFKYEIIIVDDGSYDKTTKVGWQYSEKYGSEKIRVLTLSKNKGKGGAVRMGMLSSRGKLLLFADADGATKFSDIVKLEEKLKVEMRQQHDSSALVCGSRAHLEKDSIAKRSYIRTLLMVGFHTLVWTFCVRSVKDTQCGFKLLTRPAAYLLFHNLHVERWAFDVDLLYLANYFKFPVGEVPVTWTEIDGSKIIPIFSWLQMGKDIVLIWLRYMLGAWKIEPRHKLD